MPRSYKRTITLGLDYSEFSGGINECNQKMRLLDNEFALAQAQMDGTGTASEKLALKQDALTQKINLQQQKVELAKKKYNALMDAHADTSKIDRADAALLKERTTLEKLQNELDNTRIAQSGLKENAMALFTTVTALSGAFIKAAKDTAQYADDMLTLANNTGVSVQRLQEWEYASEFVDVSLDTMTGAVTKLTKTMASADDKTSSTAKTFRMLGVNVKDAHGQMRKADDVFLETIDALGNIENKTKRDQIAMELFGKSAQDLSGIIDAGSKGMKAYAEEAEGLGRIMSDEDVEKAAQLQDALDKLSAAFTSLSNGVGLTVIPILTDMINAVAAIPTPVLTTIAVIVSIIATLVTLTRTIKSVVDTGKSIKGLFNTIMAGADPLTVKIMGIVAAVLAIVAAITALLAVIAVLKGKRGDIERTFSAMSNYGGSAGTNNNRPQTNNQQPRQVGHNANGTQNWRGGKTWVGENGAEIVDLPAGTKIYNNEESKTMSEVNNYNINMDVDISKLKSVQDVVSAVMGLKESAQCGG